MALSPFDLGRNEAGFTSANAVKPVVEQFCCTARGVAHVGMTAEQLVERMTLIEAQSLEAARDVHRLYRAERARQAELEQARAQMLAYADDLRAAYRAERDRRAELEQAYVETVRALACAIEARDPYTGGHVDRVASYAVALGQELGWHRDELRVLEVGALLHDVGKIAVPDAILRKQAPLNGFEWALMKQHPLTGAAMVGTLEALKPALPAVKHHHERFDGQGYPDGLRGTSIPAIARVVTIADAFDAMLTDRPYRRGLPLEMAIEELERCRGTQFDPEFATAFVEIARKGILQVLQTATILA